VKRSVWQIVVDFLTFPVRVLVLFQKSRMGLTCRQMERFYYVAGETGERCLDIGCGRHNRFIRTFKKERGVGVDVYHYEGLSKNEVVEDLTTFPFPDCSFDSVTFIANINHIPARDRDRELKEAFRCLKGDGNTVVTMGNPLAEIIIHWLAHLSDRVLGTRVDLDGERGMDDDEAYYLTDREIIARLERAGFGGIQKKYFITQWCLNHMFIGWKNSVRT